MGRQTRQRYERSMPKIYGNLQKPRRDWGGFVRGLRNAAWALAAAAAVYVALFSGYFSVKKVQVQGATFVSAADVQALVPTGRAIWLLSTRAVTDAVLRYPSVKSVSVQRGLPDSVRVVITEKQPAMVWVSGESAFVLDADGVAFARFDRASAPALPGVPRVYDVKAVPTSLGSQVASTGFISFVSDADSQLAALLPEVTLDHIEIAETTYDVTFYTAQGLKVEMNSLSDAGVQVRNLTRLIHQKDATLTSNVDLRVDRWAYVR